MEFENGLQLGDEGDNISDVAFVSSLTDDEIKRPPEQVHRLVKEIEKNIWGYDLLFCLFTAALHSYRADRCLRPFPSFWVDPEGKNFQSLRVICDDIPPFKDILSDPFKCTSDITNLLSWLFLETGHPTLKRTNFNNVPFPSTVQNVFKPDYIFEVCYQDKIDIIWKKRIEQNNVIYAYHGSAVDNFYSILKVGLQQHFSLEKEVLFGNGIYLSSELSVSAQYSPFCQTWANSLLGNKHSVIAICEIINNVDKVKCRDVKNNKRSQVQRMKEIPEKYFVVTDSDMVRVKYLMVYKEKMFYLKSYFSKYLFITFFLLYVLVMLAIYIFGGNSPNLKAFQRFIQNFY